MTTRSETHGPDNHQVRIGVWLLAFGQTIVWAGLFYSFAALLLSWEEDLGWHKTDIALGLTTAVLISAVLSPVAGRIVDAGYGRPMLAAGALCGAVALGLISSVNTQFSFIGLWAIIGVAQAACLYEPCFSFVTKNMGDAARGAITRISLCAGFASTIAFPAGAWLSITLGWRGAVVAFAVAVAALGAPSLWAGANLLQKNSRHSGKAIPADQNKSATGRAIRKPAFWLLAFAFPMIGLNHGLLLNHIIPILVDRGLTVTLAVTVASVIGPMQVAGRLAMMQFEHRIGAMTMTVICFCGITAAGCLLFAAGASPALAFSFAALQGAAYGLTNILKPVITAETLGTNGFGSISGLLAVPYLASFAVAPFMGAWLWQYGGYNLAIASATLMALLGLVAIAILASAYKRQTYPS